MRLASRKPSQMRLMQGRWSSPDIWSGARQYDRFDETLGELNVDRLRAAAALVVLGFERNLLALVQRAYARPLQSGYVDKHVLRTTFGCDEAKAFSRVEKLHSAVLAHVHSFFLWPTNPVFGIRATDSESQTIGKRQLPRRSDVLCHKPAVTLHHG